MDLDTLVDFGDFFDEDIGSDVLADAFTGPSFEDEIFQVVKEEGAPEVIQQEQEMRPLPEYKPEEYGAPEEAQGASVEEVREIRQEAETRMREGGKEGFMEWWDSLPEKRKETLFRATMGAVGTGAREALRSIQQRRDQEFQAEQMQRSLQLSSAEAERERQFRREMTEREYEERRAREESARQARAVAGTPSAYQFNISRGLVGQNMGG